MGGEGSGRKPDIVRQMTQPKTPIASSGGEGVYLPNYSGLKTGVKKGDSDLWVQTAGDTMTGNLTMNEASILAMTETENIGSATNRFNDLFLAGDIDSEGDITAPNITATNSLTVGELNGFAKLADGVMSTDTINLTTDIEGTLPVGNGGTGATTLTSNALLTGNGTSAIQAESNLTYDGTTFKVDDACVFNESGNNNDFRIESANDANCFFIDASLDDVRIGTNSTSYTAKLNIFSNTTNAGDNTVRFQQTVTDINSHMHWSSLGTIYWRSSSASGFVYLNDTAGASGGVGISSSSGKLGFHGSTPITKATVTGSTAGNVALQNLLTALANKGLITDSTT